MLRAFKYSTHPEMHPCRALDPVRVGTPCSVVSQFGHSPRLAYYTSSVGLILTRRSISDTAYSLPAGTLRHLITHLPLIRLPRQVTSAPATMLPQNPVAADICATAISGGVALFFLLLWEQTAKFGVFDQVKISSFASLFRTYYVLTPLLLLPNFWS